MARYAELPGRPFPTLHALAAQLAVALETAGPKAPQPAEGRTRDALKSADLIYAWLTTPGPAVSLSLTFGPVTDRATGQVITPKTQGAATMANTEIGDQQQSVASAVPLDADKQPTTDTLVWTASDTTAVTLTPSADTLSCVVAGAVPAEGVVITATDSLGNVTTGEVDIVAGPAASLSLSFGPVTDQVPAAPAAPAEPAAPASA